MARFVVLVLVVAISCVVLSKPMDRSDKYALSQSGESRIWKRFINPALTAGSFSDNGYFKMRTRRSTEEQCEKLRLCKLHARSGQNLLASYELYFVNKENARLWDHRARTAADCERQYGAACRDRHATAPPPQRATARRFYAGDYYDY